MGCCGWSESSDGCAKMFLSHPIYSYSYFFYLVCSKYYLNQDRESWGVLVWHSMMEWCCLQRSFVCCSCENKTILEQTCYKYISESQVTIVSLKPRSIALIKDIVIVHLISPELSIVVKTLSQSALARYLSIIKWVSHTLLSKHDVYVANTGCYEFTYNV